MDKRGRSFIGTSVFLSCFCLMISDVFYQLFLKGLRLLNSLVFGVISCDPAGLEALEPLPH